MKKIMRYQAFSLMSLAVLSLAACATTTETRSVEPSGFLKNVNQLQEGQGSQVQMVYIRPSTNFAKYKKIMMEPVAMYAAPDAKMAKLSTEEQKALVDYFDAAIREQLAPDYAFVTVPGPDVMVLRVAVTEAKGAKVVMNTISSIVPVGLALSTLKKVATGTHSAVAETQAEMEVLDAQTGERLIAAIDQRAGRKFTFRLDKFSKYAQVRDAFDFWAERMQTRLAELRTPQSK